MQRKIAEVVSPLADRIRKLETQIEEMRANIAKTRPQMTLSVVQSDKTDSKAIFKKIIPLSLYGGPSLDLNNVLEKLKELGPSVKGRQLTGISSIGFDSAFRVFEVRRERLTVSGDEVASELKEVFGIDIDPELLNCEDVVVVQTQNPLGHDMLGSGPRVETKYLGQDAYRYEQVQRLKGVVKKAREWLEYKHKISDLIALPIAILNSGGSPASGVVVEISVPVNLDPIYPHQGPQPPTWLIHEAYEETDILEDDAWMWRPDKHTGIDLPVDNYTYIARGWRGGSMITKPFETDVLNYHYRTELVEINDSHLWRYRAENEISHNEGILLAECLILAPKNDGDFCLGYVIRTRELPDVVTGTITITVSGFETAGSEIESQ